MIDDWWLINDWRSPILMFKKAIGDYDSGTNSDVFYTTKQISDTSWMS